MSTLFVRTSRQDPADAEVPSHKLLVRAGFIRRAAAGLYSWLPLGKLVLENVARVVREEMDAVGAQEVLLPALVPDRLFETTGRLEEYGDLIFRLGDRGDGGYLLAPTHEELFTQLVKEEYSSYRDLPVVLYQIQAKYRDEARPRSGILRAREFLMKDSYSFDLDEAGLQKSYDLHREVYGRIFARLGVRYRVAAAVSGPMGGSRSEEFLAPSPVGDDTLAVCTRCDYAANAEAVEVLPPDVDATVEHPPAEKLDTPGVSTIESLAGLLGVPAAGILRSVLVRVVGADGRSEIIAVGVPGDREVDLDRLEAALAPAGVELLTEDDLAARPDLVRGHLGPRGLPADVRYFADPRVAPGTSWITGANEIDRHVGGMVCGRDFAVQCYVDVAGLLPGDACPHCGAALGLERAIEIGHIFQLGRRYCDAFELDVQGPGGEPSRVTMGSYGIGVSRTVAVLAEQTFDGKGLCWPREVAPGDVHIVGTGEDDQIEVALELGRKLESRGVRALVDDRPETSPEAKLADAELVGIPTILVVGDGLAEGHVELRDRASGERLAVSVTDAVDHVVAAVGHR